MTPLMLAASFGKAEAAQAPIAGGAKTDAATLDGKTPLILAVLSSDLATVKALLGTQAQRTVRTGDGWTGPHDRGGAGKPRNLGRSSRRVRTWSSRTSGGRRR